MVRAAAGNLPEQNQNNKCVNRPPGTAVKKYAGTYDLPCTSKRAIAKELHCSRNTVTRYLHGDYESLCRRNYRSGMDQFYDYIIKALSAGISRKDVYRRLIQKGYKGKLTAAYDYMNKIIKIHQIDIAVYRSYSGSVVKTKI